jgi:hypothetical protein
MTTPTQVYFIKPIGMDGPIKIGCSWHPRERLKTLMSWSPYPLEIITTIPGGYQLERNIHECFSDLHLHREWFTAKPRLVAAIEKIKNGSPVEQSIDLNHRIGSIKKGKCGGASWDDVTRQKMSVLHRIRHALLKIDVTNHHLAPTHIKNILAVSEKRLLTVEEAAALDCFTADPSQHKEECQAAFQKWKARWDAINHKLNPSATTQEPAASEVAG